MVEQGPKIDITAQVQIPNPVMEWFEGRSALQIHPRDYRRGNFSAFYVIYHQSGDRTFAAKQTKTYDTNGDTEELVYLIDLDSNGKEEGHGEIRMNVSNDDPYFKNKPFVGYTATEDGFRRQGLGTRRLLIMNTFTQILYDLPLHSDTLITDDARRLWERLVAEGKAIKYQEGKNERFRFV